MCIFLKQLSEIGSKLRKKKGGGFLIVSSKHKFLEANLPSGRCMKYACKVTSGCPLVGLRVRSRGKKNGGTERWAAIHVANDQTRGQLQNSRAQDAAACRGPGAATCALTLHVGTQSGRTLGGYKLSPQSKLRAEGPNRPQHVRINGPEGPRDALRSLCQRPLIRKGSPQERARRPGGSTPLRYSE